MNMKGLFPTLMLVAVLTGCSKRLELRHIVILVDASGSIDRDSLARAFKAIDGVVGRLHRGDRIAIIPILGDAEAEASGKIIRFQVPTNRQAYDGDIRDFRVKLKVALEEAKTAAIAHPGTKTDILGSIVLVAQEFQSQPSNSNRMLIVLSDFLEEDVTIDFNKDRQLMNTTTAKNLGMQTSAKAGVGFKEVSVYLGLLRSTEYAGMGRSRREAIRAFWIEYFKSSGAQSRFVTDGPGLLEGFTSR